MTSNEIEASVKKLTLSKPSSKEQPCISNIRTIPFYVSLPCDIEFDTLGTINENSEQKGNGNNDDNTIGVAGTITLLKTSIMVWFGWSSVGTVDNDNKNMINSVGHVSEIRRRENSSPLPIMGPLAIAMPRTKYNKDQQQASTQLLGGESEEDQMMGHQISCRLSKKLSCPVLVSCSLNIGRNMIGNITDEFIAQRAAAFAEREIGKIVLRERV